MPEISVERRSAPRHTMILDAEVMELPRGAKLSARTADISCSGCYIDTMNPVSQGAEVLLRIIHHEEIFEAIARVVYVSLGLGMGLYYVTVSQEQKTRLAHWLAETGLEF